MFAQWGRLVFRWRWLVLILSCAVLAGSIAALQVGGTLVSTNTLDVEAARAAALVKLGEAVTRHEVIGLAGSAVDSGADYVHESRPRSKAAPVGASVGAVEEE